MLQCWVLVVWLRRFLTRKGEAVAVKAHSGCLQALSVLRQVLDSNQVIHGLCERDALEGDELLHAER